MHSLRKKLLPVWLVVVALTFTVSAAFSQQTKPDKIIRRDQKVIEAVVEEVSMNGEVAYKKFSSPKGATFKMPVKEIASIEYANGYVDEFPEQPLVAEAPAAAPSSRDTRPAVTTPAESTNTNPSEATNSVPATPAPETPATTPVASASPEKGETAPASKTEAPASTETAATATVTTTKSKKSRKTGSNRGVELPGRAVTGFEVDRIALEDLQADARDIQEYVGVYEWRTSPTAQRIVAYQMEWDNVNLVPKEWTGYAWRHRGNREKDVKLRGNKLIVSGKTIGTFMKFEQNGKEIRGFLIEGEDDKKLFLWKIK